MKFTNILKNTKLYEIEINIKAFKKPTALDIKRMNLIARIITSLGFQTKIWNDKEFRNHYDEKEGKLFIDINTDEVKEKKGKKS